MLPGKCSLTFTFLGAFTTIETGVCKPGCHWLVRAGGGRFCSVRLTNSSAFSCVYRISGAIETNHHTYTHREFRVTIKPNLHVFGLCDEAEAPKERRRHEKSMQTLHRRALNQLLIEPKQRSIPLLT